jgi:hypothetical protein
MMLHRSIWPEYLLISPDQSRGFSLMGCTCAIHASVFATHYVLKYPLDFVSYASIRRDTWPLNTICTK